jgi:hypothetical protein
MKMIGANFWDPLYQANRRPQLIGSPLSLRILRPTSTWVPAKRTTRGTLRSIFLSANTIPSAAQSQRLMPAKMLTRSLNSVLVEHHRDIVRTARFIGPIHNCVARCRIEPCQPREAPTVRVPLSKYPADSSTSDFWGCACYYLRVRLHYDHQS